MGREEGREHGSSLRRRRISTRVLMYVQATYVHAMAVSNFNVALRVMHPHT